MADNPVHELLDPKTDYYQVFADIDGEDLEWWKKAREFGEFARPYINEGWEKAEYQIPVVAEAGKRGLFRDAIEIEGEPHTVSYTHLTLPTTLHECRSRWSPYH